MKKINLITYLFLLSFAVFFVSAAKAQDDESGPKPARKAFESPVLIENQTDVINTPKTLEWNIQHRFGTVANGTSDLFGIFAPSNIRLGFSYSLLDRLGIGFGLSKVTVTNPFIDLNIKYKILQQATGGGSPVNLTYFGNVGIDTRDASNFDQGSHRFSYFHELIFSRRFNYKFSAQIGAQFAHFNAVDTLYSNDMFGLSLGARYKISAQSSIIFEWTEPLMQHDVNDAPSPLTKDAGPNRNIALGLEVATSAHVFQMFISTYRNLVPQQNLLYNTNSFTNEVDGKNKLGFEIGFNITRLWNF